VKRGLYLVMLLLACLAITAFPHAGAAAQHIAQLPKQLDWPFYGNDLGNMRFVDVDQITSANVGQLRPAWVFHTGVGNAKTSFESQPIIVDGTLYISSSHDHVYALDAATGALKWTYNPDLPPLRDMAICCGQTNRGVAVGQGKVYIGQLDATLVALDAQTGTVVWKTAIDDWHNRWTGTMAPQYVDGRVLVGASGGEFERRGYLSAYDAETGKLLWRFHTVPGPGEVGHDTWSGDSWRTGGAPVWTTPAVDRDLGLVYLSTGNASPDLNGSQRAGMNLFTASVVAIDLNSGQYRWHFQEVHHDIWDYDGPEPTHLFTLEKDGQQIPAIGHANKNGFYFILDRRTGRPLYDVQEVPVPTEPTWQNPWPSQPRPAIDPLLPQSVTTESPYPAAAQWTPPREQPQVVQPGAESGPEWPPAAYSPRTRYSYIPAGGYEPWVYHAVPGVTSSLGSVISDAPSRMDPAHYGLFDAVDTTTGKIAWQMKTPQRVASGAVVAGDLVFVGESDGHFHALDARSGKKLWTYSDPNHPGIGGSNGAPAVYVVNGREYVVTGFGGNTQVRSGQVSPSGDALIAFALPLPGETSPNEVMASPRQVPTGEIPQEGLQPIGHSAPAGARVVDIAAKEILFSLSSLSARPGERIAVHLTNQESVGVQHNIAFDLPSGRTGMDGVLEKGEDGYFIFTAPTQPGAYQFWCDVGAHRFLGMSGTLTVQANGGSSPSLPNTGVADRSTVTFPETGYSLAGRFLSYWRGNGGLPVFGYPIDSEQQTDGRVMQWFERERFELHPEHSGTPYEVELGRLGAEELAQQGQDWSTFPKADPQTSHYVAETGHAIAPQFWDYWRSHGLEIGDTGISYRESLALFGYPLSEAQMERGADGQMYLTQWFERARFEYHPNNSAPYQILLGRLGAEVRGK